jgi:uncharacterized protein YdhG (YjbR/CyaY superfamily)
VKKAKSKGRKTAKKSRTAAKSVDEYLAGVPEPGRSTLNKIRAAIRSVVPSETTEIISYGIPAFKHDGVLIWYAAFADHCSLFPTAAVIETFKSALKSYTISKGTIQFPLDKPLPAALVKEMVRMRIAQTKSKKRG